jgi:hypothetical protein
MRAVLDDDDDMVVSNFQPTNDWLAHVVRFFVAYDKKNNCHVITRVMGFEKIPSPKSHGRGRAVDLVAILHDKHLLEIVAIDTLMLF